jgi:hypothetical protein
MKMQTKVAHIVDFLLAFCFGWLGLLVLIAALFDDAIQKKPTSFAARKG